MSKGRTNRYCFASLVLLSLFQSAITIAAPVVDTSSPTQFSAPTAAELADASTLILIGFGTTPGSVVLSIRSAPSDVINPGLDSAVPAAVEGADTLEVGLVPSPSTSYSCPPATPVTITISNWSLTLLGADPSLIGAGGGGGALLDSRNLSATAPATMATASGTSNPAVIGGTNPVGARQYAGTFADLPFLTYMAAINAVRISGGIPVQSHYQAAMPSITLEYDDATCTAVAVGSPVAVPAMGLVHLLFLCIVLPIIVAVKSRAKNAPL